MERFPRAEVLRLFITEGINRIRKAGPGEVQSYDDDEQVADVIPQINRDGVEDSVLQNIPVLWPRAGNFYLKGPLSQGDTGVLLTCDYDIGAWRSRGQRGDPGDDGNHELAYSVFLPVGLVPNGNALPNTGSDTVLAGNSVKIGAHDADQKAVLGTAWAIFMAFPVTGFLDVFKTWAQALATATGVPSATIEAAIDNYKSNLNLDTGDFISQTVELKE